MNRDGASQNEFFAYSILFLSFILCFYIIKPEIIYQQQLKKIQHTIEQINNKKINIQKITSIDTSILQQSSLFGTILIPPKVSHKTSLPLKLIGVIENKYNHKKNSAIIMVDNNPAKIFKVGSMIAPNVLLHKVFPFKVIINNNGKLEHLFLPKF